MKKLIALALVLPLTALGCDWGKKKPTTPTANESTLTPVTPQTYVPPASTGMGTNALADTGGGSTLEPINLTPPPSNGTSVVTPSGGHSSGHTTKMPKSTSNARPSISKSAPTASGTTKIGSTYTVKSGDSLSEIAAKAYGKGGVKKGTAAIKKANNLKNDVIKVGQKLKIPSL